MTTTTMGVKLDDAARDRIQKAAQRIDRTPHWLIKQAILHYLDILENGGPTQVDEEAHEPIIIAPGSANVVRIPLETSQVFQAFTDQIAPQSLLRAAITAAWRRPETEMVPLLLEQARQPAPLAQAVDRLAARLSETLRRQKIGAGRAGRVQHLLQEFSLSSQEGIAMMCLAEALLRIPDKATRDELIRDKISRGNWQIHLGRSQSLFVNAAAWGLLLTGRLVSPHHEANLASAMNRIISKGGEPLIRKGMDMAMRLMGEQFVTGQHIGEALANARRLESKGFRYSYDMLGEAALTADDAQTYMQSYQQAIDAIGQAANGRGIYEGPGISIKLSALHPRYCRAQYDRVMEELYPRLLALTLLARHYDIGINIDAEEADRLELSLDLLGKLCFEPALSGWNGIGFVIQAYQKRCPRVIDELIDLAKRSQRRLMIRLVKGAYWDSEIKRAQIEGLEDYPVFTRKAYTDISYLACARQLLAVPQYIYPQFATHNAQTLAAVYYLAGQNYYPGQYEFQCLHGMGEPLYDLVVGKASEGKLNRPCRIYAPVGSHETLLAYLVRRLLENGANSSFVNRIADPALPLERLIADPVAEVALLGRQEGRVGLPHPAIPLPRQLYGALRLNSYGLDLANEQQLATLSGVLLNSGHHHWRAEPIIAEGLEEGAFRPMTNPADHRDKVGDCRDATGTEVQHALAAATHYSALWSATPGHVRASILERAAGLMESYLPTMIGLLIREAGKSYAAAIAEIREAVDFLRYYAGQIQYIDDGGHTPLGPVLCISPWNFPLSIFIGQVAAALSAGNSVLAKPAEQTPLIASQGVLLLLEAGVPAGVLQLLPGDGAAIGGALAADDRVRGVMFTGSTAVARLLQKTLVNRLDPQGRPIPLIAETGGVNAMIVDSSALTEQVVNDIIISAFDSAGQRCSALRLLCVQEEAADRTLQMLRGAMNELALGDPRRLSTDIGPVIDRQAKQTIDDHIAAMRTAGHSVWQGARLSDEASSEYVFGTYVPPTLIELESVGQLTQEIFGPVLHVVRFRRHELASLLQQINDNGYGLTLGLHTRIDATVEQVIRQARVGNCYVNRNMVGAVVGVQPFGGQGLSGTGPKAGGPLYLYRLLARRPADRVPAALLALDEGRITEDGPRPPQAAAYQELVQWAAAALGTERATVLGRFGELSQAGAIRLLTGPTGEQNTYRLLPRERILCLAADETDLIVQLAAVTAIGAHALWNDTPATRALFSALPQTVQSSIVFNPDWLTASGPIEGILYHGEADGLLALGKRIAERPGPVIQVNGYTRGETGILLEPLLVEQSVSINTAAAGGNASLMTMG